MAKGPVVLMLGNSALLPKAPLRQLVRRHCRPGERVRGPRDRRRRAGKHSPARPGDDRMPPVLSRALGAAVRHDG
jgi:hypothetical protein